MPSGSAEAFHDNATLFQGVAPATAVKPVGVVGPPAATAGDASGTASADATSAPATSAAERRRKTLVDRTRAGMTCPSPAGFPTVSGKARPDQAKRNQRPLVSASSI